MKARPAVLTLTDTFDTIVLRPELPKVTDPVVCKSWDLGAPEVRTATQGAAGADGNIDSTTLTGSRTVTFDLQLMGDDPYDILERLAAMTHPTRRPTLKVWRVGGSGEVYEMGLRGNPFSVSFTRRSAAIIELQLTFEAPLGYLVSALREVSSNPAVGEDPHRFKFPATFPISTGHGSGSYPVVTQPIGGSAPVAPTILIYGPAKNPRIEADGGRSFAFTGLTLATGQYVEIDMGAGTVRLNGATNASLYHLVDWAKSTFWTWLPRTTPSVRYVAAAGQITVRWRERRLTI